MKKSLKRYLWTVAATVFFTLGLIMAARMELLAPHHRRARNPEYLWKKIGVELPDTLYTLSDNNLDRGASRWDNFWSEVTFASPLTDEQKQKLDRLCKRDSLHWTKETEPRLCYEYFDDAWGERGGVYTIHCRIYEDEMFSEYLVDEYEGMAAKTIGLLIVVLMMIVLPVWGLMLGIVAVEGAINKRRRQKSLQNQEE